jgi:hypothetical protein
MRIKSRWFKDDKPKSAQQSASVMAFIVWRLAQNALKQMRLAQFDIDPGWQYFAFLREFLVFLIQVADRIAYAQLEGEHRAEFTTALVIRVAEILEENQDTLLGSPAERSHKSQFIELFNEQSTDYATMEYGEAGPDFAFLRYLGNRIMHIMIKKDQSWVIEQVMEIEAPQAVADIRKGMQGLFDSSSRREQLERLSGD